MHIVLKWTLRFLGFLAVYIIGSRIFSAPAALTLHFPRFIVFLMILGLDLLQIPLFYYIYNKGFPKIKFLKILFDKLPTQEKFQNSRLGRIAQNFGSLGVIFTSILPTFGGGIWSAVLFARILRLDNRRGFLLIATGALLGCLAVVYGYDAIFRMIGRAIGFVYP